MSEPFVLGYFNIRGLGQPIRYLLKYVEADYTEKTYQFGPPPQMSNADWLDEKFELGLDFPGLPYLLHGSTKLTQSLAILRYLGRQFELNGQTPEELTRVDLVEQQTVDLRACIWQIVRHPEKLAGELAVVAERLAQFERFFGDGWTLDERLTYVDFLLFETLDALLMLKADLLDELPRMQAFRERFAKLPAIEAYRESEEFAALTDATLALITPAAPE